jgi:hypothetical protein
VLTIFHPASGRKENGVVKIDLCEEGLILEQRTESLLETTHCSEGLTPHQKVLRHDIERRRERKQSETRLWGPNDTIREMGSHDNMVLAASGWVPRVPMIKSVEDKRDLRPVPKDGSKAVKSITHPDII